MQTNNHQVKDYSAVLAQKYGEHGTAEREAFDDEAYTFYTSQVLQDARREAKVTQSELARRVHTTKSYISRIENGYVEPSVAMFYRIISALGFRIDIVKPLSLG